VVLAAIAEEPAIGDIDQVPSQCQRGTLLVRPWIDPRWIGRAAHAHLPSRDVYAYERVAHGAVRPAQLRDREDEACGGIIDRRASDAQGRDITARQVIATDGRADIGVPVYLACARVEGIERIGLGRHDHHTPDHEWLGIDRTVEVHAPGACELMGVGRVAHVAAARRVAMIHRPIGPRDRGQGSNLYRGSNWLSRRVAAGNGNRQQGEQEQEQERPEVSACPHLSVKHASLL
jgi:hypothetical protein